MSRPTKGAVGIIMTRPARDGVWLSKRKEATDGTKKFFAGYDQTPGGKIDPGEDPIDAAVREALEETGLVVPNVAREIPKEGVYFTFIHRGEFLLPDGSPYTSTHYLYVSEDVPQHIEKEENDEWRYVPVKELHMLSLMESTRTALEEALVRGELSW